MKFETWGMTGTLSTQDKGQMAHAEERLWHWLDAFNDSCNRFRANSEITRLNEGAGRAVPVSETFAMALDAALLAADATGGLCDPTVLPALLALGYDEDYDSLVARPVIAASEPVLPLGTLAIDFDREAGTVALAPQCRLDLGASAKALVVDLVAADVAPTGGVVVELGGDVAVRGVGPEGPWAVGVADTLSITGREPRVSIAQGGIATSSLTTRVWLAGGRVVNHIIDPRTGTSAQGPYATATVSAASCVLANAFATAAVLWGEDAGYRIAQAGWSARLVRHDGTLEFIGGWPRDEEAR